MSKKRQISENNIYHVTSRGTGKQIIYEDDDDKRVFLHILRQTCEATHVELYAWCLMDNHFHLLVHSNAQNIANCMRLLCSNYARWFNEKAGRMGHLFQGRYNSEAIDSDAYLLTVIRYIHENPAKGKISEVQDYRWSSYKEYLGRPIMCNTNPILELFGSRQNFINFHRTVREIEQDTNLCKLKYELASEDEQLALNKARLLLGDVDLNSLKILPRQERNKHILVLKKSGLTVRQIERFTGIGRNSIARALKNYS